MMAMNHQQQQHPTYPYHCDNAGQLGQPHLQQQQQLHCGTLNEDEEASSFISSEMVSIVIRAAFILVSMTSTDQQEADGDDEQRGDTEDAIVHGKCTYDDDSAMICGHERDEVELSQQMSERRGSIKRKASLDMTATVTETNMMQIPNDDGDDDDNTTRQRRRMSPPCDEIEK